MCSQMYMYILNFKIISNYELHFEKKSPQNSCLILILSYMSVIYLIL